MGEHKEFIDAITQIVQVAKNDAPGYLIVALMFSAAAMSVVEVTKAVIPFRKWFHEKQVRKWLDSDDEAIKELHRIVAACGGTDASRELYDEKTAKLMAQIQVATTTALDFPNEYPRLYLLLTKDSAKSLEERRGQGAEVSDNPVSAKQLYSEDHEIWQQHAETFSFAKGTEPPTEPEKLVQRAAQARARLGTFVERKLDGLQNRLERTWRLRNQLVAIGISFIMLEAIFFYKQSWHLWFHYKNWLAHAFSLAGGLPAPLMKDLYVALCSLRPRNT
jgi:hypothetical protein